MSRMIEPLSKETSPADRQASRWLKEKGKNADQTTSVPFLVPAVAIEKIVHYAHDKKNRRKDIRWAGAIAVVMLAASFVVWYQNRLNWEMTHSSWSAHARHVVFPTEID